MPGEAHPRREDLEDDSCRAGAGAPASALALALLVAAGVFYAWLVPGGAFDPDQGVAAIDAGPDASIAALPVRAGKADGVTPGGTGALALAGRRTCCSPGSPAPSTRAAEPRLSPECRSPAVVINTGRLGTFAWCRPDAPDIGHRSSPPSLSAPGRRVDAREALP